MIEIAAVLSAAAQRWEDFSIIIGLLLVNAGVGFREEFKADNAIEALKKRLAPSARVLRDGRWQDIVAVRLVPGDVVFLRLGNIVPVDVELLDGEYLSVDQLAQTGESLPVEKKRSEVAYSGSVVHFQQAVLRIGNFFILTTLGLESPWCCSSHCSVGVSLIETVLFALILTIVAIPVALPAVMTVTHAVGASKLACRRSWRVSSPSRKWRGWTCCAPIRPGP